MTIRPDRRTDRDMIDPFRRLAEQPAPGATAALGHMGEWGLDPAYEQQIRRRSEAFLERARRALS